MTTTEIPVDNGVNVEALLGVRELLLHQPVHVRLGPRLVARIMQAEPQQERRYMLALGAQILHRRPARSGQIAHRLVARIGNPDRG